MDRIYKHASLTIVAAAGGDSWCGLPGLRENSRSLNRIRQTLGRFAISCPLDDVSRSYEIGNSDWAKRGWTLQEHVLSARLLIFAEKEVFWECNCADFQERVCLENWLCPSFSVTPREGIERTQKPSSGFTPLQRYNFLVNQASTRNLTYAEDAINCVQGLLNDMSDFPGGFWWGMPLAVMDSSLLFHAGVYERAPLERRKEFPYWSWAGWNSVACFDVAGPYDTGFSDDRSENINMYGKSCPKSAYWMRKEVVWYRIDQVNGWVELPSAWISQEGSQYYSQAVQKWQETDAKALFRDTTSPLLAKSLNPERALCFWTQTVELEVDHEETQSSGYDRMGFGTSIFPSGYPVRESSGRSIGCVVLTSEYRASAPNTLKFVMIAQNRRWERKVGPLYDLLHVFTVDGITSRIQVLRNATVDISVWQTLTPTWEFIVMV